MILPHDSLSARPMESVERLETMASALAAIGSGILILNPNLGPNPVVFCNPAFELATGIGAAAFADWESGPSENILAESRLLGFIREAVRACQECSIVIEKRRDDGRLTWNEISIWPIRQEPDGVSSFVVGQRDVTSEKSAQSELARTRKLLEAVESTAHAGSFDLDLETREARVSEEFCRLFGFSPDEKSVPLSKILERVHLRDRSKLMGAIPLDHRNRALQPFDLRVTYPQGGTTLQVRGSVMRDSKGGVARILGTMHDVTAQRGADERQRQQIELFELTDDAVSIRDLEGRITFWNRGAEQLSGIPRNEAVGKLERNLFPGNMAVLDEARAAVLQCGHWREELHEQTPDGHEQVIDARWTLVRNAQGTPTSILAVHTDITQRRDLEERFLRTQRMEAFGAMAGGVAHDLNNILTPIMMSASLLHEFVPNEAKDLVETIETAAERGSTLVNQVLTVARGMEGRRGAVQPKHLLSELAKIMRKTFPRSIEIRASATDLWAIEGDATQLHQVLLNLCSNARDAMPAGGVLTLSGDNFDIDEGFAAMVPGAKAGPHVVFRVTDTGSGIPSSILAKIFDPFFTTKPTGKGTGLGLSTVDSIVKAHGGGVKVRSTAGRGTTFEVFLPAITRPGAIADGEIGQSLLGNGETILVVDDEPTIREVLSATLTRHGYRVMLASDGTEALASYARHGEKIAVVITDVIMPFFDGVALARSLKKLDPKIEIIACSGMDIANRAAEFRSLDVKTQLSKPFTTHALLDAVHTALAPRTQSNL